LIDQGSSYNTVAMDVISGNTFGLALFTGATGNSIYSDTIGADVSQTIPLGNSYIGVYTYMASGNYIDFNVIAYNGYGTYTYHTDQNYYYGNGVGGSVYADSYGF